MRRAGIGLVALLAACGASSADDVATDLDAAVTPDTSRGLDAGADASRRDAAPGCGTCPTGYTCGAANGLPVCKAPSGIPLFSHVFVIVMENTTLSRLDAATNTPYLAALKKSAATSTAYHGVAHPSLPNYIAMMSGGTQGIGCDCNPTGNACNGFTCNVLLGSCGCTVKALHFGDALEAAGKTWKAYGEGMGTPCNTTSATPYATRHVPFLYFDDVVNDAARCAARVVDYGTFAADLAAAPAAFSFIAPNLTNDMHDPAPAGAQNLANGDTWLKTNAQAILDSPAYKSGGLLVIVWDEDDNSGIPNADDPVPLFVMSPYAKSGGYASSVKGDHYALLATFADGLGVTQQTDAAVATPLVDFFPAN